MKLDEITNLIIKDNEGNEFRVINIDYNNNTVNIINVNEKALPIKIEIDEIIEKIKEKTYKILDDDLYVVIVKEENLTNSEKEFRDKVYEIMKPILNKKEINIYDKKQLNKLIKEISLENGISKKTIKRYLIRYLARGQNKNAFLPDYYRCGGLNKEKNLKDVKVGAPRTRNKKGGEGINITSEIKDIFQKSINEFYNNQAKKKLTVTYELMIGKYFRDKEGNIKPENEIPSLNQFRYWHSKKRNIEKEAISRQGEKKYNLNMRGLKGTSLQDATYPTAIFQIDSTIADVELVSRYNRSQCIGRPIIYIVIDVFSRMITGFYAGLENASWTTAMMAIYNCTVNKVDFCKKYDIDIKEEEWNCSDLPDAILCDKGSELTGKNIENLANIFNVEVKNTPSYRADLKGIVENIFGQINSEFKQFLPGAITSSPKERGEPDSKKSACLDIIQINKIIIHIIINHNNKFINSYKRDKGMIEDNVKCIPTQIWEWGMKNRVGYKPRFRDYILKLGLMPSAQARVTDRGIKFNKMYYTCTTAIDNKWTLKAKMNKTWSVDISYDPRDVEHIYLTSSDRTKYEICTLIECENRYKDKTMDEIYWLLEIEKDSISENTYNNLLNSVKKHDQVQKIIKNSKEITEEHKRRKGKNRVNKTKIRENRKKEKEAMKPIEVFTLCEDSKTNAIINKNEKYNYDKDNEEQILDNKKTFIISNNIGEKRKKRLNKRIKEFQDKNL